MSVSPEFEEVLRAGRPEFNARITQAKQRYPGFNTDFFSDFLKKCVDPIVIQCTSESRTEVATTSFDIAINIVGRELYGNHRRGELMQHLWLACLPKLNHAVMNSPEKVLSSLSNALLNLSAQEAVRCEQWLQLISIHGPPLADADDVIELGMLAAWRSGAAQYRPAALRIAKQKSKLASNVFNVGGSDDISALCDSLESNPWLPNQSASTPTELGSFSGFGGAFEQPPTVIACEDGFLVKSADKYFLLLVDCFGSALLPATRDEFEQASQLNVSTTTSSEPQRAFKSNLPTENLQIVSNEHSTALFSPYSFSIHVWPIS